MGGACTKWEKTDQCYLIVDAHATKLSRYRRGVLSNGAEWPLVVVVVAFACV